MSEFGLCQVRPSTLRFTHNSVSCKFSNGLSLEETFRQFLYDELDVDDMQCLEAMHYNGKWLVVRGNRRLYLYKKLEKIRKFTTVKVDKLRFENTLFERQYTSHDMGVSIRIRGFPNIENVLNQITNEWRNTQGFQNSSKTSRRRGHRSTSGPRSGITNAVAGNSGQNSTTYTESHTPGGNSNHGYRPTYRPPTSDANQNLHTSGGNHDFLPSTATTTTLSVTQNRSLASKVYVPPPRSNDYIAPTPSVNHNSSLLSQRCDQKYRTSYIRLAESEQKQKRDMTCCTIL